jgi:hypothetical protein
LGRFLKLIVAGKMKAGMQEMQQDKQPVFSCGYALVAKMQQFCRFTLSEFLTLWDNNY